MTVFILALLAAGGATVVYFLAFPGGSSGELKVTGAVGDVVSLKHPEALSSNSSTLVGKTPSIGSPGQTFTLRYDIVYQACACGPLVVEVDSLTPGFTVVGTTPSLPVQFQGAGGDFYQAGFTVEVKAPATSYTGTITLLAHIG